MNEAVDWPTEALKEYNANLVLRCSSLTRREGLLRRAFRHALQEDWERMGETSFHALRSVILMISAGALRRRGNQLPVPLLMMAWARRSLTRRAYLPDQYL